MNVKPSDFSKLNFQPGSKRGLAKTLAKVLAQNGEADSSKTAWDFVGMLPENFTREDVEGLLVRLIDQDSNTSKSTAEPEPATNTKKEATSINAQARELLLAGNTVGQVATILGKSRQRIVNVQKLMTKEADKASDTKRTA